MRRRLLGTVVGGNRLDCRSRLTGIANGWAGISGHLERNLGWNNLYKGRRKEQVADAVLLEHW